MSGNESTLDSVALANLRDVIGGDVSVLVELVNTFLDDAPNMLAEIRRGVAHGDAGVVHLNAHSLKGNAADFGALTFAELCLQMERLGKSGGLQGASLLLNQIEDEFPRVEAALNRFLESLG